MFLCQTTHRLLPAVVAPCRAATTSVRRCQQGGHAALLPRSPRYAPDGESIFSLKEAERLSGEPLKMSAAQVSTICLPGGHKLCMPLIRLGWIRRGALPAPGMRHAAASWLELPAPVGTIAGCVMSTLLYPHSRGQSL